jgi:hypothetical protein
MGAGEGYFMQTPLAQLADVETRLQHAVGELRIQQSLLSDLDFPECRRLLAMLLGNGLRAYDWLEDQHFGLMRRLAEEPPRH